MYTAVVHSTGGVGGVNGDEMGLGKTCQCAGLLAGLFHTKQVRILHNITIHLHSTHCLISHYC
jgi:SNF2 family DNA or RNA helicase